MKKLIISILSLFIITGCTSNNTTAVEGTTEREIAACKLIKEFSLQKGSISDFSEIKCEFIKEETTDNSILISLKHKDYQDNEYLVLIVPENNIFALVDSRQAFKKEGNEFKEMNSLDMFNYLNQ